MTYLLSSNGSGHENQEKTKDLLEARDSEMQEMVLNWILLLGGCPRDN